MTALFNHTKPQNPNDLQRSIHIIRELALNYISCNLVYSLMHKKYEGCKKEITYCL